MGCFIKIQPLSSICKLVLVLLLYRVQIETSVLFRLLINFPYYTFNIRICCVFPTHFTAKQTTYINIYAPLYCKYASDFYLNPLSLTKR